MSIDEQPMNVYWSGQRTETSNKFKVNDKGSVTDYSNLPSTGNQKGDMYTVTNLNGENYIWNGTAWDSLGTSDSNVVHKTGDESVTGTKTFGSNPYISNLSPGITFKRTGSENTNSCNILSFFKDEDILATFLIGISNSENTVLAQRYNKEGMVTDGSTLALLSNGGFYLQSKKGVSATGYLLQGTGTGSLSWNGQEIQTASDERLKTEIAEVDDATLDVWEKINWCQFKFKDAVKEKGEEARLHLGLVAQAVKRVFDAEGVDACRLGILCHDEKAATEDSPAVDLWTIRYAEALALEAVCQRRRADRLEARIKALEEKLK